MLYTDPEGKKVFTDSQPTTSHFTISHHTQDIPSSLTIPDIKAKIAELQKQLAILEVTINNNNYYCCIIDSIMQSLLYRKLIGLKRTVIISTRFLCESFRITKINNHNCTIQILNLPHADINFDY